MWCELSWSPSGCRPTLPTEHDGPVSSVSFSPDGLRVLSTTTSGHLGFLDVPSREYTVLARSHMAPVLALSTEPNRGQMATVSLDHTVRIWDLATLQQVGNGKRQAGDKSRHHTQRLRAGIHRELGPSGPVSGT